ALGGIHSALGDEQLALDLHKQSIDHFQAIGNQQGQAAALNGLARAYEDLNEDQAAFDNYQEALRLYEAIGNRDFAALNRFYVGKILYRMGETEQALTYYRESLDLSRKVGDRVIESHALKGIAAVYLSRQDIPRALAQFGVALGIYHRSGNLRSQAYLLNDIGHAHLSSGNLSQALANYRQALPLMRATGDCHGEALTFFNMARAERDRGNLAEALPLIKNAIAISEFLRAKIRNSSLRTSYFASVHQYYELYIDVLMQLHAGQPERGFAAEALVVSEQARARSLLESLLQGKIEPRAGELPDLFPREQELLQALDEKAEYQARLLAGKHTEEEAERVAAEIRALMMEYQDIRNRLREQNPRAATLTQPGQLRPEDLQSIVSDRETLLLEFALGDERSYLWVVSSDGIESHELPGRSVIEALARRVYDLLTVRQAVIESPTLDDEEAIREADAEYWRQAAALSQALLGSVADQLGSKRLLIVSDGFLQFIPFDALPTPDPPRSEGHNAEADLLFVRHEIVGLPSALILAAIRREERSTNAAAKTVAVLADPVFDKDDSRVLARRTKSGDQTGVEIDSRYISSALRDFNDHGVALILSRLPATRREAKAIMDITPPDEELIATDFAATREMVVRNELKDYRIIHFATHGLLNSEHPELSGVILSLVDEQGSKCNGFLRLHDIYNLSLSSDLVVLSACRTGLGKNVQGEGVVGLTSGFLYAGAKSVVASLWKVDDDATQELMSHFYAALLKEGLPPAAALRAAKRELWKQEQWRAPFYWAAFTLQGEYTGEIRVPRRANPRRLLPLGGALALIIAGMFILYWRRRRRV
ncbi:MAG: CHAT domain-containing protein, partial [Blastocatellia bacterium]